MFRLRLFFIILKALVTPKRYFHSHLGFWAMPWEIDINFHLNNSYYLKYMDLGRWDILVGGRFLAPMAKEKLGIAAVRLEIDFKKAIAPCSYFSLNTKVVGRTEKTIIFQQNFSQGSHVVAQAKVICAITHNGRATSADRLLAFAPIPIPTTNN